MIHSTMIRRTRHHRQRTPGLKSERAMMNVERSDIRIRSRKLGGGILSIWKFQYVHDPHSGNWPDKQRSRQADTQADNIDINLASYAVQATSPRIPSHHRVLTEIVLRTLAVIISPSRFNVISTTLLSFITLNQILDLHPQAETSNKREAEAFRTAWLGWKNILISRAPNPI